MCDCGVMLIIDLPCNEIGMSKPFKVMPSRGSSCFRQMTDNPLLPMWLKQQLPDRYVYKREQHNSLFKVSCCRALHWNLSPRTINNLSSSGAFANDSECQVNMADRPKGDLGVQAAGGAEAAGNNEQVASGAAAGSAWM